MKKIKLFTSYKTISLITFLMLALNLSAQSIISWTEQNGILGLGYPVPIPVDTPDAFDGFRTYDGLFAKHQMMALENEYITGHIVGQTHYNRDIWAYLLSDGDNITIYGVKEGAMMANGGIHAREWQSPETLTQIITDFHDHSNDESFYQYLLENTTIITIPINNIDGFLQTQRYPTQNWYSNSIGPRDGRMRRKNLLNTDELLATQNDFLRGVDLNRNNDPYWASSTNNSSNDPNSIVYHGPSSLSEPESLARLTAADLVDADQMRIYTDVHSFSQVHFANKSFNTNLNTLQNQVLTDFSNHHKAFPAGKDYINRVNFTTAGFGIGSTDEYFQNTYQIPSWTLEIEPSGALNPDAHPSLPGVGADYGGFANNFHDGFILPESEIKRVREQLAETFMVTWYGQAGPPSITQIRIIDLETNAIVFDAEWDITGTESRELYSHHFDEVLAAKDYTLMIRFDKPMRYRNDAGQIEQLQGQFVALSPVIQGIIDGEPIELNLINQRWVNQKDNGWESFANYQDDTFVVDFNLDTHTESNDTELIWKIVAFDMIGQSIDANPATVVTWANGQWQNYEDSDGDAGISGGFDQTITTQISAEELPARRMQKPQTALYFDPDRNGEGFNLETLEDDRISLQWYTFDEQSNDQWMLGTAPLLAENAIYIPEMLSTEGGFFGADFISGDISLVTEGSIEIVFESAGIAFGPLDELLSVQSGRMKYTSRDGRKFRAQVNPITFPAGVNSPTGPIVTEPIVTLNAPSIIGSWYDPNRNGEGFHIQETINGNAAMLWYSYDLSGEQKWFIGSDGVINETNDNVQIIFNEIYEVAQGTRFGSDFDADEIQLSVWGNIELNLQCTTGTFTFESNNSDYGMDTYNVVPITRPIVNQFECQR